MKNILIIAVCAVFVLLSSCKDEEPVVSFFRPDCLQAIIEDLQDNDTSPDCLSSIKQYTCEDADVFEIQTDDCLDGAINIIDMNCDTICTLTFEGFTASSECGDSANFYDNANLVEVVFEEEN